MLDELHSEMQRFHVIFAKGEEVAVIEEGDEALPSFFYCRGMRITSILISWFLLKFVSSFEIVKYQLH